VEELLEQISLQPQFKRIQTSDVNKASNIKAKAKAG
jgi:hypothetical protein